MAATASCAPPSAVSWIVGGSAAVGSSAELRLTNPGSTSVTAHVTLLGSTGELSLPSGGAVSVPAGETRTYGQLATAIGAPRAVRAVGLANGANPVGVIVPCHRVKRSDGSLGGFRYGLPTKQWLLDFEAGARSGPDERSGSADR